MLSSLQTTEYDSLIKKIRRRQKLALTCDIIATLITLGLCFPGHLEILNVVLWDHSGIHPLVAILLILLISVFYIIALAIINIPIFTAMDIECNPKKHLALHTALIKAKNADSVYALALFYMGSFEQARLYADKMIADKRPTVSLIGLFNKSRCDFFLGDFESLKQTVEQYEQTLNRATQLNKKNTEAYTNLLQTMRLLVALADNDKDAIGTLRNPTVWNTSKATEGFIHYLAGVASYVLEDEKNAIYHLMSVSENCKHTFLAQLSEEYLAALEKDN